MKQTPPDTSSPGKTSSLGPQTKPRITILATGGTIAGQGASADRAGYIPAKLPIEHLLRDIPSVQNIADIRGEQFASLASYYFTLDTWVHLARRINELFDRDEADGIVITHGTDTMEETAYFLTLTVRSNRPVVLTGSMRPATAISADGPKNLFDAIVAASAPQSRGKGVMVCFNETLYDGKHVVKINTTNVAAFGAPHTGPIGQVYDGRVAYFSQPLSKRNGDTPFDITQTEMLPRVEIAYMYVDASPAAIHAFVQDGVDGLIIAGSGDGSLNIPMTQAVEAAVKKGVAVVRSSRVPSGRVSQFHAVFNDEKLGTIAANDLNPQKARVLLMLALTVTEDKDKIQQMFLEY